MVASTMSSLQMVAISTSNLGELCPEGSTCLHLFTQLPRHKLRLHRLLHLLVSTTLHDHPSTPKFNVFLPAIEEFEIPLD